MAETALCFQLPADPPDWIMIMPVPADGVLQARDGRRWTLRDPAAVVEASRALNMDLPVDYEHQTDLAEKNGQPAPAAGWIKALEVRADGIWARVEWTDRAREMLAAKEYRYLSPVFMVEKKTDRVLQIQRVALTNNPALEIRALARREGDPSCTGDETMDEAQLAALRQALGLDGTADGAAIVQAAGDQSVALASAQARADEAPAKALATIADAAGLSLKAGHSPDAVATAVAARLTVSAGDFVPKEQYQALAARLTALEERSADTKATDLVDSAVADGKLAPATRDWALGYAKADPDGFTAFVDAQPVIVKPGQQLKGDPPKSRDGKLDEGQLETCRLLGLDPKDYAKTLAEEAA